MHILLIDHGRCDPPDTRAHHLRASLGELGARVTVCGPSSIPAIEAQPDGMFGIDLHAIAAASRKLMQAVESGSPDALLAAVAGVSPRLLGLVRETARQGIAEAVDATNPDVIFVLHAGILTDLAIETGAPVAVHVAADDLVAAAGSSLRELVLAALGSCDAVVADGADTADAIRRDWIDDASLISETWPASSDSARRLLAACEAALARRSE